jgi:predicted lipid-binding transport protein (Tim44 family)
MRKILVLLLMFHLVISVLPGHVSATAGPNEAQQHINRIQGKAVQTEPNSVQPYRRGAIRSPRRSYNPGIAPGRTTPETPGRAARNPAAPGTRPAPRTGFGGFFGGLFGGLALGTIMGSLFNPFAGFSLGFPFLSLVSVVLWIIVIYAIVRMFRRGRGY